MSVFTWTPGKLVQAIGNTAGQLGDAAEDLADAVVDEVVGSMEELASCGQDALADIAAQTGIGSDLLAAAQYIAEQLTPEGVARLRPGSLPIDRELEGIATAQALALAAAGITRVNQLCYQLRDEYEARIPAELRVLLPQSFVQALVAEANLCLIPGLDPYHAHPVSYTHLTLPTN